MDQLTELEQKSIYIIREAYAQYKNKMAMLWSIGKDSTSLLWLCRKAFFGKLPFPVMHIDTSFKFKEIYQFRNKYSKEWGLNLIVAKNGNALKRGVGPKKGKFECCTELKTNALKLAMAKYGFRALLLAIRRDEHGIRAKERVFCFPQGTLIYGPEVKPIQKVKENDLVWTHLGSLKKVQGISERYYKGKVISITPRYGMPICMTSNHVVLAKVRSLPKKIIRVTATGFDEKIREINLPIEGKRKLVWLKALELKKGDRLLIPKLAKKPQDHHNAPKFIHIDNIIGEYKGFIKNKKKLTWKSAYSLSPLMRRSLPVTPDMMRVIGYYAAEGSANFSSNQFEFSFGKNEENLATDVVNVIDGVFGIKGNIRRGNPSVRVQYSSKTLMLLFQHLCGKGARNKRFPFFFTNLTNAQLRELVKGCWLGDGSKERYTTTSRLLAHQMRMAMLRLGILTSIKTLSDRRYNLCVAGVSKEKFKNLLGLKCELPYSGRYKGVKEVDELHSTSLSSAEYGKSRCGGFWVPIDKIELVDYEGPVYDLCIEDHSSYLVEGVAVHNSPRDNAFTWNYKDQPAELWNQYKSKLKEDQHFRIHPMLHWTERNIWEYILRERIPITSLYFSKNGKRYRSIGCETCCNPVCSNAKTVEEIVAELKVTKTAERAGRAQDKEQAYMMQKLRTLGYM